MSAPDFRDPVGRVRILGKVEGISFLILLVCSAVKRLAQLPLGVQIVGPIHGALFLLLLYWIFQAWDGRTLTKRQAILAAIASVIPFGPFLIDRRLAENATQSENPAD